MRDPFVPSLPSQFDYSSDYFSRLTNGWHETSFPIIAPLARRVMADSRPRMILDYGCGTGAYAALLAEQGATVEGCDVSDHARAVCQGRYDRLLEMRGSQDLPDARYDLVFSTEVLEHIADHRQTLRDFHRALRPGGTLLLTTTTYAPSVFALIYAARRLGRSRMDSLRGVGEWALGFTSETRADRFVRRWCFEYLGGHYHGFRRRALARDLRAAGFERVEEGVFHAVEPLQLRFLHSHGLREFLTRPDWPVWKRAAGLPLYCLGHPMNALMKRFGWLANNLHVIARKPLAAHDPLP